MLAYGALLKSGRLTANDEMVLVINQLISGSKMKNYIQTVAFGFLEELCLQVVVLLTLIERCKLKHLLFTG